MEKIRLGKTGLMVSRLGFGGIPIQRDSEEEAIAVVRKCLDLGITYLDTANAYGNSEERIGKAIADKRDGLIISTKTQSRDGAEVKRHLQNSLQKLGTDCIDLYQFHNVSNHDVLEKVLAPNGPLVVIKEAQKAGVVRHIGVTSHQIDTAKEAVKTGEFETIMFPFNFITHEPAEELLPLVRDHNMGYIAMKPLDGGMIENVTLAFKYILQFPDVVPIPGMQKVWEVEQIVKVMTGPKQITAAEKKEMQLLRDTLGQVFCRRCGYCQPCSSNVPIQLIMDAKSLLKKEPDSFFEDHMGMMLEKAMDCIKCGECEGRCPYHLPIRKMIAENYQLFSAAKKMYRARNSHRETTS